MAPGKGYFYKFLPVLTLIDKAGNPKAVRSKFPSSGKPSTPFKLQLFLCYFTAKSTLWYISRAGLKNLLNSS